MDGGATEADGREHERSCRNALDKLHEECSHEALQTARAGTVLYQLGTHRRGARTLEQSVVALRNSLSVRTQDADALGWALAQNNLAAAMQALGEHEEDIASLEACIPIYDAALKVLTWDRIPLVWIMVSANRASAKCALAGESDYLDLAEAAMNDFEEILERLEGTDYQDYREKAQARAQRARGLAASLQV